jgi:hypothetical protein
MGYRFAIYKKANKGHMLKMMLPFLHARQLLEIVSALGTIARQIYR